MSPRVLIACMIALVFAAGAASDMAVDRLRARRAAAAGPASWAELARVMKLSPQQQQRIDSIFATWQPRSDAILRDLAPRLRALADSIDADVFPILTTEQRAVLSRMQQRQVFVIRRRTPHGERVDTIRLPPREPR